MTFALKALIAGTDRTCDIIDGTPQLSWGRSSLDAQPDAATLTLVLDTAGPADDPALGADLEVVLSEGGDFPSDYHLFRGYITDLSVEITDAGQRLVSVMSADPLSVLADVVVGDAPWPQEYASVRAQRVCDLAAPIAGRSYGYNPVSVLFVSVLPRDVDAQPALRLLHGIADTVDAILWFDPGYTGRPAAFNMVDRDATLGAPRTWELELSPRTFRSKGNIINAARIGWGTASPQAAEERTDPASIAAHLRRYRYIGTELATAADAGTVAQALVDRWAQPRWQQNAARFSTSSPYDWRAIIRAQDPRTVIRACSAADRDTLTEWRVLSGQVRLWHDQWDVTLDLQEVPA